MNYEHEALLDQVDRRCGRSDPRNQRKKVILLCVPRMYPTFLLS